MLLKTYFASYLKASPEIRGSQEGTIERLGEHPLCGKLNAYAYTPQDVIAYAKSRSLTVQPVTIASEIGYWRKEMDYAEVGLGLPGISDKSIRAAMPILEQQRLLGTSNARDRTPTEQEQAWIIAFLAASKTERATIEAIDYQHASARRVSETCRHEWGQFDAETKTILIVNMKHPRKKTGHNKRAALTDEAYEIILRQPRMTTDPRERIFKTSVSAVKGAYIRAKKALKIEGLHLHDARAGVVTRLLKDGYTPAEVQLVTVNSIAMINNRYNRMRPEDFPRRAKC